MRKNYSKIEVMFSRFPDFRVLTFCILRNVIHFIWLEKRYVHSFKEEKPAFFLASLSFVQANLIEHPPLVIYDSPGVFSSELQRMLKDEFSHG